MADDDAPPTPTGPNADPVGEDGEIPASDPNFDSEFVPDGEEPIENPTSRPTGVPALRRKRKSIVARLIWFMLIILIIGVAGGGVVFQNKVIETWPAAIRLYTLVGLTQEPLGIGLNLLNVKFSRRGGNWGGLLVEGEVENSSDQVLDVPSLRATLFDQKNKAVQRWPFKAPLPRLLPGEIVKFKTIIKNPVNGAARIEIDFHEERPQ